jgi:hypothetical protein
MQRRVKKTVKRASPSKTFAIRVLYKLGPFSSVAEASATKKRIKAKIKRAAFSAVSKSQNGYHMQCALSYKKKSTASASAIKASVQRSAPGTTVTVKVV